MRVLGQAAGPTELSGLARSRDGTFWTHNDSGDGPRLFHLSGTGALLGEVTLQGATAVDWEDIAIRGHTLYVGDIGDNAAQRPDIAVYKVAEGTANATKLTLRYPDGAHDAETLLVDPRSGGLAIVTKDFGGNSGVYVAAHPSATATTTLRRAARLRLGLGGLATAGDVSADGRVIVVRTYTGFVAWERRRGDSLARAMRRTPCAGRVSLAREGQGEALALTADGGAFLTVPEGLNPVIRRYAVR